MYLSVCIEEEEEIIKKNYYNNLFEKKKHNYTKIKFANIYEKINNELKFENNYDWWVVSE